MLVVVVKSCSWVLPKTAIFPWKKQIYWYISHGDWTGFDKKWNWNYGSPNSRGRYLADLMCLRRRTSGLFIVLVLLRIEEDVWTSGCSAISSRMATSRQTPSAWSRGVWYSLPLCSTLATEAAIKCCCCSWFLSWGKASMALVGDKGKPELDLSNCWQGWFVVC